MTKHDMIITKLATLAQQNIDQTGAIVGLKETMDKHIESSNGFRRKCSNNSIAIRFVVLGIGILFTTVGYLTFAILRAAYQIPAF